MTDLKKYTEAVFRVAERCDTSMTWSAIIPEAIRSQGITHVPDVRRISKLVRTDLEDNFGIKVKGSRLSTAKRRTRGWWLPQENGLSLYTQSGKLAITIPSFDMNHVTFKVQVGSGWHELTFAFKTPFIVRDAYSDQVRISHDTYAILYWFADSLMRAVLSGFPNVTYKPLKRWYTLMGGVKFYLPSVHASAVTYIVDTERYQYSRDHADGAVLLEPTSDCPSDLLHRLLSLLTLQLWAAYKPYAARPVPDDHAGPLLASVMESSVPGIKRKRRTLVPKPAHREPCQPRLL